MDRSKANMDIAAPETEAARTSRSGPAPLERYADYLRFAAVFLAAGFLAAAFFGAAFLAAGFLTAAFLAAGFFAAGFLAAGFFAATFFVAAFALIVFAIRVSPKRRPSSAGKLEKYQTREHFVRAEWFSSPNCSATTSQPAPGCFVPSTALLTIAFSERPLHIKKVTS